MRVALSQRVDTIPHYHEVRDGLDHKWIPFLDTESKSLGKNTKGLLSLNPELLDKELIITLKKCPEWLEDERQPFIKNMKVHLDNTKMKYKLNIV